MLRSMKREQVIYENVCNAMTAEKHITINKTMNEENILRLQHMHLTSVWKKTYIIAVKKDKN